MIILIVFLFGLAFPVFLIVFFIVELSVLPVYVCKVSFETLEINISQFKLTKFLSKLCKLLWVQSFNVFKVKALLLFKSFLFLFFFLLLYEFTILSIVILNIIIEVLFFVFIVYIIFVFVFWLKAKPGKPTVWSIILFIIFFFIIILITILFIFIIIRVLQMSWYTTKIRTLDRFLFAFTVLLFLLLFQSSSKKSRFSTWF